MLFWRNGDRSKMDFVVLPGRRPRPKGSGACLPPPNGEQTRVDVMSTLAAGAKLSSTIRSFSAVVHRRRRSGPDRTVTIVTFAHLLAN